MHISQFDYILPKELIAQSPASPRDHSNLMIIKRSESSIKTDKFFNLPDHLTSNDVLVFNNTKVFPARIYGKKGDKSHEVLLLNLSSRGPEVRGDLKFSKKIASLPLAMTHTTTWECLVRGKIKEGNILTFPDFIGTVVSKEADHYLVEFSLPYPLFMEKLYKIGNTPIPPYIKSGLSEKSLREKYQTIYAQNEGSSAAPTAGLHFTDSVVEELKSKNIKLEHVTLHVGLGTFAPVREENLEEHTIHSEYFTVDPQTIKRLNEAKRAGKRIIAVGTTTTRVLETLADNSGFLRHSELVLESPLSTHYSLLTTNIFIFPPYKFKFIKGLITNFHLPKSTLLALVSAFVSYPNTKERFTTFTDSLLGKAYQKAIEEKFKFFSFGDGMLIL